MVKTETSLERIAAYVNANGGKFNMQMAQAFAPSKSVQYRIFEEGGEIKGYREFQYVLSTSTGERGITLVHDISNGFEIEPDLS